jgi:hypothetical protein
MKVRPDPLNEALQAPVLLHPEQLPLRAANDGGTLVGAHDLVIPGKSPQAVDLPPRERSVRHVPRLPSNAMGPAQEVRLLVSEITQSGGATSHFPWETSSGQFWR